MKNDYDESVGIVAPTLSKAGLVFVGNLLRVTCKIFDGVVLLTGSDISPQMPENSRIERVAHRARNNRLSRIIGWFLFDFKMASKIIASTRKTKAWLFFLGGETLPTSFLCARALSKRTAIMVSGAVDEKTELGGGIQSAALRLARSIGYRLCDIIITYTPGLVEQWHLERYQDKIRFAHEHVVDLDSFRCYNPLHERGKMIGFVGRLSKEKGIANLIEAMEILSSRNSSIKLVVCGDGPLRDAILKTITEKSLDDSVVMAGWVSHEELARYLNEFRLLVIPSFREGLPNVAVEAMACGTPVLANSIGSLPDVITDSRNGFLMEDNKPATIAREVIRAMESEIDDEIARRGRTYVETHFADTATRRDWTCIRRDLLD